MKKWYIKNKGVNYNEISKRFNISNFLAKLIVNRDVTEDKLIESFLNPCINRLHPAEEMKDVEKAAKIIKEKILEKKKITPRAAEAVGYIFQKSIRESNETEKEKYMEESVFSWNPPKKVEGIHVAKN